MTPSFPKNDPPDEYWELLYSSPQLYKVGILKNLLDEEDIASVIVNRQDSAYVLLGEVEIYVRRDDLMQARVILTKFSEGE